MSADEYNHSQPLANVTPWFVYECTIKLDAEYRRISLFLLYLFVFVVGLLENTLVVWVNWRRRHSANGVLFCVLNVSLSDLMVIAVLPFFMMEVTVDRVWLWGRFLCKLTSLIYGVNFYTSSLFLAAMTLERYLSLSRPSSPVLFPAAGRRRWALCGGVWLFSLLLALVENVHVDLLEWDEPGCYMLPEGNYIHWFMSVAFLCLIFQFLGPASVIITCNVLIARTIQTAPDVQDRRDVWLVHVYSLVFVMCWLPYHLVMMLMIASDISPELFGCNMVEFVYFSFSVVQSLSLFHCVANPILYNFLSKSFRDNLVNAVMSRLPGQTADAGTGRNKGGGDKGARPKSSHASTSQSDVSS
ncbi:G-protein coupled receptor 182 [Syngnathoides biaculeatus]|uniref:G-protein coupled receptor 182 n=1 Tax=Syngnathoides biaculeatus TaxID=300417 RepID=UPI002ADE5D70|nr:G-protein coupled receptor 182 [Syngnathoides biaculeatus]XP_061663947.1 G-protein coupled receptor 182 [Syngnathoides biaculeatus]XP_061663951.1 G-protein coupled receptor 182 [Syngnathoides biaculeatus]